MHCRSLTLVPDHVLLQELKSLVSQDRATTAALLAHLGECDARRLYLQQAYSSMHAYCVGHLRFSDDTAFKRIRVARAARRFPAILDAIADGRLNVSGVVLIAPLLTTENAATLLTEAANKTKAEIELLVATHAPRPDVPTVLEPVKYPASSVAPGPVALSEPAALVAVMEPLALASAPVAPPVPMPPPPMPPARLRPLAPERFAFQVTLSQETRELMKEAQDAMGNAVAPQDYDTLLREAFKALIARKRHERFAETSEPRACRGSNDTRYVPAAIKREVFERDQGQCTFVSESGMRCACRRNLEYDHLKPVAKGGRTSAENLRLLCRAHNQFEAGRVLGPGFMQEKRAQRECTPESRLRT